MNLQSRVHRRLSRHRAMPPATVLIAAEPGPADGALLAHLAGSESPAGDSPRLREAARQLLDGGEPVRLGLRAGELADRLAWFTRLLRLWPADAAEAWMRQQVSAARWHALAGSPLHDALDGWLFDTTLSQAERQRLWALWLAVVAPGAVCLDEARRAREEGQALRWLEGWLAPHRRPPGPAG
ncbi:hypothetical protein [Ideonella sp.]|uniref:hypothetical protein n=1 Tax=Ideonella sp. TaxID=1929293 RepID=UPI0035B06D61